MDERIINFTNYWHRRWIKPIPRHESEKISIHYLFPTRLCKFFKCNSFSSQTDAVSSENCLHYRLGAMKNHKNRIYFHMQAPLSPLMIHSLVKKTISKGPSMYSNCLASKKKNLWFALIQLVLKYADNQRGEEDGWTWLSPWFWKTILCPRFFFRVVSYFAILTHS